MPLSKTRLTIKAPEELLAELLSARSALKRSRGKGVKTLTPHLDELCMALQVAKAAGAVLTPPPAPEHHPV